MPTVPPTISPLPTPPSRDDSTNFTTRADAFLGALPTLQSETNATATNVYNNAVEVSTNATTVQSNTTLAVNSATAASNSAGAAIWVSGTTYAIGAVRWSPANGKIYRRITSGGGTTDPSLDPTNWVNVSDWNGGIVVNELGADVDFRIESDTNANAFFVQGSDGYVGINTSSPATQLVLSANNSGISAGTAPINTLRFNDTDTILATSQPTGRIEFYTNDSSTGGTGVGSFIESRANGPNGGGTLFFGTSASGTTGTLQNNLVISATGGVVFNEDGEDIDFRVESDTNTHALFVDGGNSRVGVNNSSPVADVHVTPAALSGALLPVHATGGNVVKKTYLFASSLTSGQSLRIANTTNILGRSSGMFLCKFFGGNTASNTSTSHIYAIFSFRVLILASGGTASIQGLTALAEYGITVSTDVTFTDNGSGSWHIDIANPTPGTIATGLEIEFLSYNGGSTARFTDTLTSSVV